MSDFPTLETGRLHLRELTLADSDAVLAIHADPDAMRWFGTDPMPDQAAAEKLIEQFAALRREPNPGIRWGIVRQADDTLIGNCGLFRWNPTWHTCMVGYILAREAWGQGYMREALNAALDWGFANLQVQRVDAQTHPDNSPSIRLLENAGFVREGRLRQAGFWHGQRHDLLHFGLLREEHSESRRH